MSSLFKAALLTVVGGLLFLGLLLWGLPGPKAGPIQNPVATSGQVVLTGVDGKRCSIQARFEVKGKSFTTRQVTYSPELCRYRLGQVIPIAYDRSRPENSAALQKVVDHPVWPALLAGLLALSGLLWLALLLKPWSKFAKSPPRTAPRRSEAKQKPPPVTGAAASKPASPRQEPVAPSQDPDNKVIPPRSGITPPGWYSTRGRLRWWNGQRWTDNWQDS